MIVISLLSVG